jgi:hypothetical protein
MNQIVRKFALPYVVISFATCSAGWAASPGGIIRGNTNINVNTKNVSTIAAGGGIAKTSIGNVRSSNSNTNVTVDARNVSNVVSGHGRKGCINIGTKGLDPDCN